MSLDPPSWLIFSISWEHWSCFKGKLMSMCAQSALFDLVSAFMFQGSFEMIGWTLVSFIPPPLRVVGFVRGCGSWSEKQGQTPLVCVKDCSHCRVLATYKCLSVMDSTCYKLWWKFSLRFKHQQVAQSQRSVLILWAWNGWIKFPPNAGKFRVHHEL